LTATTPFYLGRSTKEPDCCRPRFFGIHFWTAYRRRPAAPWSSIRKCRRRRNVTDEVIDFALRYRVQAPMIDTLMKEIGIEGGSLGRVTDVLRDVKDISALTRDSKKGSKEKRPKQVSCDVS